MSLSSSDDAAPTNTVYTANAHLIPVYTDGSAIVFDNNDATITGDINQIQHWSTRTGTHDPFIKHHAVRAKGGRGTIFIDHPGAYSFISGDLELEHDFLSPCPPTAKRLDAYKASPTFVRGKTAVTAVPTDKERMFIENRFEIAAADADLLISLNCVFGKARWAEKLTQTAAGSGYTYLLAILAKAKTASIKDKTAVKAKFNRLVLEGVPGALTPDSLSTFLKAYEHSKKKIEVLPTAEEETEMINLIALKEPDVRDRYETLTDLAPPTAMDDAVIILEKILAGRERSDEIDNIVHGARPAAATALVAAPPAQAAEEPPMSKEQMLILIAAAIKEALPDPKKNKSKKSKPTWTWKAGMGNCKYCDGQHLHKDCTSAAGIAAEKERAEKAAAGGK